MSERRIRFQFIDALTGDLVRVYESPTQAAKRGFGEVAVEYGYVARFSYEEARELLGDELKDIERRLGDHERGCDGAAQGGAPRLSLSRERGSQRSGRYYACARLRPDLDLAERCKTSFTANCRGVDLCSRPGPISIARPADI
jgi:hypothetical protein